MREQEPGNSQCPPSRILLVPHDNLPRRAPPCADRSRLNLPRLCISRFGAPSFPLEERKYVNKMITKYTKKKIKNRPGCRLSQWSSSLPTPLNCQLKEKERKRQTRTDNEGRVYIRISSRKPTRSLTRQYDNNIEKTPNESTEARKSPVRYTHTV